jgi:hypothetical protein
MAAATTGASPGPHLGVDFNPGQTGCQQRERILELMFCERAHLAGGPTDERSHLGRTAAGAFRRLDRPRSRA